LHDVGASIPEEFGVERESLEPSKGFHPVPWHGWKWKPPFNSRIIRADGDDLHLIEEGERIDTDTWLRLVPLGMANVNFPVRAWLIPCLPPARSNQQKIPLLDVDLLSFGGILQIFQRDPIPGGKRVRALVFGDIQQDAAADHVLDARRIAVHCSI